MYKDTTTNTKIDPYWLYIILEEIRWNVIHDRFKTW